MEETVEKIHSLRYATRNVDRLCFVPEVALFEVMEKPRVKACLECLKVPLHELDILTDEVMRGARKCFAILLLMGKGAVIKDFITHDGLLNSSPDDRLPFNSETLKNYFKVPETNPLVLEFMEKQWYFATPALGRYLLSRELSPDAILPYLYEEEAGNSSMGRVLKVTLHPKSHRLQVKDNKVIRKEISSNGDGNQLAFKNELRNLSLLACIHHPNIIELQCSYFYRGNFNLIFPVAEGGTLETILEGPRDSVWPITDSQIFIALTGLASAIDTLHNFESKSLNLELTGCHHDLAPRNILVQDDKLLLADFGLSTFKCRQESSLTNYKTVRGSYVAPEGQRVRGGGLKDGQISRPGDIWSLGCILLEVVTYMINGHVGLSDFRAARRTVVIDPELVWCRFYDGCDVPSFQVAAHIERLLQHNKPSCFHSLSLVQRMLNANPKDRPGSAEVLMTLRGIAILSLAEIIKPLLDNTCACSPSVDYSLESFRFSSWMSAFKKLFQDITSGDYRGQDLDIDGTIQSLSGFQQNLQVQQDNDPRFNHQRLSVLRWQGNKMFEALPNSYRSLARTSLVEHVLRCDHVEGLSQLHQETGVEDYDDLGTLLAVKHLTQLSEEGRLIPRQDLQLDDITFVTKCEVGPHSFALINGDRPEKVIIEWLKYEGNWADTKIGLELRERLVSIAALLNSDYTYRLPGTLRCKGIEHNSARRAFGFVYELPPSTDRPMTLNQLLQPRYRPLLEDRFSLARDVCHSLYKFHQLGWLHRNIHSENIVFVLSEGPAENKAAKKPHFLGFSRSRETRLDAFTRGADDTGNLRNYHHPAYLQQDRYREEFDYYSIGMILLEIGLWTPLSKIALDKHFAGLSDEDFRQKIIERKGPQLGLAMGSKYMQAVLVCLRGDFNRSPETQAGVAEAFKRQVIASIQRFE